MKIALGKKSHMTQIFDSEGVVHPVTIIDLEPLTVSQIKTMEKDGYSALQVAYNMKKGVAKSKKEFRMDAGAQTVGAVIDPLNEFVAGDLVQVSATSKGKGFAGVVKRHGFRGGNRSHGNHHSEREPGSIGSGLRTRVPKGMRMAGRMGSERVTIKNKTIVAVDKALNIIMVSGSIPGKRGTVVEIQTL